MSTVGIFAGRGDVLVAMAFAILIGFYFGYKWRGLIDWFTTRKLKKETP
jgi:Na+/proline symporter